MTMHRRCTPETAELWRQLHQIRLELIGCTDADQRIELRNQRGRISQEIWRVLRNTNRKEQRP